MKQTEFVNVDALDYISYCYSVTYCIILCCLPKILALKTKLMHHLDSLKFIAHVILDNPCEWVYKSAALHQISNQKPLL